ncbi:MAG: glycoside hydrolase family 25 [Clostridiales bacterium]|nr:glycoside hydrolase family 25 [Clostridiales bacterium]
MEKKKLIIYGISIVLAIGILIFIVKLTVNLLDDSQNKNDQITTDTHNNDISDSDTGDIGEEDIEDLPEDDTNGLNDQIKDDINDESNKDTSNDNPDNINNHVDKDNDATDIPTVSPTPIVDIEEPAADPQDPIKKPDNNSDGVVVDIEEIEKPKNETDDISYGIDVAKWQGVIDWSKVKEAGVDFAMIRIGYRTQVDGKIIEDPYAKYNLQQGQKHGIKLGVYFFSTAVNEKEVKEEAKWVTKYIAPYKITYPVAFNCEGFTNPDNRQYGMTKDERSKLAILFLDYMKDKGYVPMFYGPKSELEDSRDWDTEELSKRYKIWLAHYPDSIDQNNMKSSYSGTYDMWQYTSKGSVPGIKGEVDFNIAYFGYDTYADPKEDKSEKEVIADPGALINFKEVNEKVTAKEITNLRDKPSLDSDSKVVYGLEYGDTAIRTGIGDNGWSRVEYKGKILYAVTSYLTTDLNYQENNKPTVDNPEIGITFSEVKEKVTAKIITNLRLVPSADGDDTIVTSLENGDIAIRTGIGSNGWSRVEYEGQILYAVSNYLEIVEDD